MLGGIRKYRKTQTQECLEMLNRTLVNVIELPATRSICWRNLTVWTGLSPLYWFFLKLHLIRFDGLACCLSSNRKSLCGDEWVSSFPSPSFSNCLFIFLFSFLVSHSTSAYFCELFSSVVPVVCQTSATMLKPFVDSPGIIFPILSSFWKKCTLG